MRSAMENVFGRSPHSPCGSGYILGAIRGAAHPDSPSKMEPRFASLHPNLFATCLTAVKTGRRVTYRNTWEFTPLVFLSPMGNP